jgi:hypothetical protein
LGIAQKKGIAIFVGHVGSACVSENEILFPVTLMPEIDFVLPAL